MKYRADIDGLRAVAILPVLFYHAGVSGFSGGFVGVDVFFVISGYLITKIIWHEIEVGQFSIAGFYERRIRRIFPPLLAVLLFSGSIGCFLLTPAELTNLAVSVVGSIFFVQNFILEAQSGYFDAASETKPLLHVWSLAVEEQFYIVFPLALLLSVRFLNRRGVIVLMALSAALSFALSIWLVFRSPALAFYMMPLRAWELLAGSFLAILVAAPVPDRSRLRDAISAAGLGAILAAVVLYDSQTAFPGASAVAPVLGAAALIWAGPLSLVGRALSWRPLVFIGLISYSLYLWHWPLIVFHKLIFPESNLFVHSAALIAASFIIAIASWRYIERPFRQPNGMLRTRQAVFSASGAAAGILVAISGLVIIYDGWSWRFAPDVVAFAETAEERGAGGKRCVVEEELFTFRGNKRGFCRIGAGGEDLPRTVVWGDSHVDAWYPLLDAAFSEAGQSALAISLNGCPAAFGLDRADVGWDQCRIANRSMPDFLEKHEIERVLIVSSWFGVLTHKDTAYAGRYSFDHTTRVENVLQAIADTGDRLEEMGINSGFMMTVPGARHSVPEALFRQSQLGFYPEIRRKAVEYEKTMGPVRDVAEAHYNEVWGTEQILCQSGYCDIVHDGMALYYDSNHPSAYLNEMMLPRLQAEISDFAEQ